MNLDRVYIIAEIGINHNGSLDTALELIDSAVEAGADCVKFQIRTPEICVPKDQWEIERETPWGRMTYIDYRHRMEFSESDYWGIADYCQEKGIQWTASCWDEPAVDLLSKFSPPFYKAASASLTDPELLRKMRDKGPLMISTGMSTWEEIETAVEYLAPLPVMIAHSTSSYPCEPTELNLRTIHSLQKRFPGSSIGYSGHEKGIAPTVAAVAMGAKFVERHITLDRTMWGSDQAASLEPQGLKKLVRDIRTIEAAMGDGIKRVYDSELPAKKKLRRF